MNGRQMERLEAKVAAHAVPAFHGHKDQKHPNRSIPAKGHSGITNPAEVEITGKRARTQRITGIEDFFGPRKPR